MDKSTEELIKKRIIGIFPKLATDKNFKLTSPINPNYNCLAWACHYNASVDATAKYNSSSLG